MNRFSLIGAWVAGLLVTGLYAYAVFVQFGNLLGMQELGSRLGLGFSPLGWFWLLFGIVLPFLVLVAALLFGRRLRAWGRVLLLAAGLAVVAVAQLDVMHVVPQAGFFA